MKGRRRWFIGLVMAFGVPSSPCLAQSLEDAASVFVSRWGGGEVAALEESLSSSGVRIQWEARQVGSLDPGHAVASIREYMGRREGVMTRVIRVEEVGGDPPRGYAEIRWESRMRGISDTLARTVFVAFISEGEGWRITELRVLPQSRP